MPGERAELRLKICVDDVTARALARGEKELEDMLVLHVEGGNDTFITVTGEVCVVIYVHLERRNDTFVTGTGKVRIACVLLYMRV